MRCRSSLLVAVVAACAAFGAVGNDRAGAATPRICVDTSSPTAALDRAVAGAAAARMRAGAAIEPYDGGSGVSERFFRFLARGHCALIMGFPVDSESPDPPAGLALTHGYASTGYVIASLGPPPSLATIPPGATVAVGTGTAPDFYLVGAFGNRPAYGPDVYPTQTEVLDALVARSDPVAMVWQPSLLRYRAAHPGAPPIRTAPLPIRHATWALAALYDPRRTAFAQRFDRAVAALRATGALARLTAPARLETTP